MRSVSKAWPARLLAALTTLALVAACVIGAYAHAAGHPLPQAAHAADLAISGDDAGHRAYATQAVAPEAGHIGGAHDCDKTGHSPIDCCDTICHGGQAILATDAAVPHQPHSVPVIALVAAFDGAELGGLDRPPKAFPPA